MDISQIPLKPESGHQRPSSLFDVAPKVLSEWLQRVLKEKDKIECQFKNKWLLTKEAYTQKLRERL